MTVLIADFHRAGLWRGLAVSGCDPVPDSGGEEPPIHALIPACLAARSDPDLAANLDPAVWWFRPGGAGRGVPWRG